MKKSAFWTFIFSCWPGAGQMYLGYTKRGASLMTGFLLLFGASNFLNLWLFATFTPVVWFYAFFDAWSIRNMDPAKRERFPDDFLFFPQFDQRSSAERFAKSHRRAFGIALILLGFYVLYNNLLLPPLAALINTVKADLYWLWRLANGLPTLVVAALIILLGLRLVRGERHADDEIVEYRGEEEE